MGITRRSFVQGAALAPFALQPAFTMAQSATQADRFDVVVAGAGHNSLIAACYLAKAGFRCVVLEGRPTIGGGTKTAELTLSGFAHDTCSSDHVIIQSNPLLLNDELHLKDYGLEYIHPDPHFHVPFPDGSSITQWMDFDRTCDEIAQFSKKDAATFRRMADEADPIRKILASIRYAPVGYAKKTADELLAEHPQGKIWQRRMLQSAWNNLHQFFEDPHVITFLIAPWPENLLGASTGMTAFSKANRHDSSPLPKWGSGMLALALARYLEAHGGVILPNKPVTQLIVEGGKCVGVECADGSAYRAEKAVLSTIHIKHLVSMAPKKLWGDAFMDGVESYHVGAGEFNVHYALKRPLVFPKGSGTIMPVHSTSLSSPERALRLEVELATGEVDFVDPVLHMVQPTSADPTRAPKGMHVLRILGREPWNLKNGGPQHYEEIKEQIADAHLKAVQRLAPSFTNDMILARTIVTPPDLTRMNPHAYKGCLISQSDGPAQLGAMRPVPGWAQHRMPIPGLYQTGGTTHPGFGVTGAPGRNAAWVMLKDFGTSIEEVIAKKEKV